MKTAMLGLVILFSLTLQARTLDAEIVRLVGDEDGTKVILKAENQNQIVLLKKNHAQYAAFLGRLQSAKESRSPLKIEIEKQVLQILKDIK
jgi:hypothetical protein